VTDFVSRKTELRRFKTKIAVQYGQSKISSLHGMKPAQFLFGARFPD
jgi:hypothetical protein